MVNNNAQNLIKQVLSSGNTIGLLQAKDVGGTIRYIADFTAYPSVVEDTFTLNAADPGISVGSSTTTPTASDYQLGNTITSGLTAIISATNTVDENDNSSIIFNITITNTSSSNIEISEIGYKQEISASDSLNGTTVTDRVFLLDRSTFDTITLAPNGQAVLNYSLKAAISNSGGVVGSKNISTNGVYNAIDDSLDGYSSVSINVQPNVDSKSITTNGSYDAEDDDLDGYSTVVVSVSPNVGTKTIITNGTYSASTDSYDGYSEVTVNVPSASLDTKTITQNGTYDAEDDDLDGYSSVAVNVSPNVGTKSITENGTYNASTDNLDGFSQVTVDVSGGGSVLGTKTIIQNSTYAALDDNYDGYSEVTVNVLNGKSDILATPRMTSDTTPSGVVTASSNNGAPYLPYYAFSESCGIDSYTWVSATDDVIGAWIQYEFPQAETIVKLITINRGANLNRAVKTFIFQGSNDGTTWTDIENCSITSNASFHREEFLLNNSTAYIYYRLYITSAWDASPRWVGFAQIQMYKECITGTKTITQNGTYNAYEDDLGGYSQVLVNVGNYISRDIVIYEFITTDSSGTGAAIRVNKYINGVLDSYTDVGYNAVASQPRNFDDYFILDYGITTSYNWTYTLLRPSVTRDTNATYSWPFGDNIVTREKFADFVCEPKTITENGIYYASSDDFNGYSRVIVDVDTGEQSAIQITSYVEEVSILKGNANSMIDITAMIDSIIEEV